MTVDGGVVTSRLVPVATVGPRPLEDVQVSSCGGTSASGSDFLLVRSNILVVQNRVSAKANFEGGTWGGAARVKAGEGYICKGGCRGDTQTDGFRSGGARGGTSYCEKGCGRQVQLRRKHFVGDTCGILSAVNGNQKIFRGNGIMLVASEACFRTLSPQPAPM